MKIMNYSFTVSTSNRNQMVDITDSVQSHVTKSGIQDGDCIVFCPHTTAAITINENADPDVTHDVLLALSKIVPHNVPGFEHSEGNSDSHTKSSLVGASETVLIKGGRLLLGTWQAVYFCEFDGPRTRSVMLQVRGI